MVNQIHRLGRAPLPTINDPHAQIKWAFFQVTAEKNERSAARFRYSKNVYINFVNETHAYYKELEGNPRFYLHIYWESDALIRFNKWLNTQNLSSRTRYGIYKDVRQVMDVAYALCTIDSIVYHAPMFKGVSETKQRAAYSQREQEIINAAIAKWISLASKVLNGYSPSAEGIPYRQKNQKKTLVIDGKTFTIEEARNAFGVTRIAIQSRILFGWSDPQVVGLDSPPKKPGSIPLIINDVFYESISQAAQAYDLDSSLVTSRLRSGCTPEQAVGIATRDKKIGLGKPVELEILGKKFRSIKAASEEYGLDYRMVKHRIYSGWSEMQALGLEARKKAGNEIVVEGLLYSSLSAAEKAYGVSSETIGSRLRKGLTPEQAVGITPIHVSKSDDRAILWMFENTYQCNATAMLEDFQNIRSVCTTKRLLSLFARWGVWPYVDAMLIMPLAVEFAMLTGMNVESLKELTLDSYIPEHPLTGQPAISYHKSRSGSSVRSEDKELHLPVLEVEELYVGDAVAVKVFRIVSIVKELTAKIRNSAPSEIANRLFIFEDVEKSKVEGCTVVVAIDPKRKAGKWKEKFAREEGLYGIFGAGFNFNIARCRPTLATNMVLAGADLFQVQTALGQKSVLTAASYLDQHQLQPVFNKTISEALQNISRRSWDVQENHSPEMMGEQNMNGGFTETLSGCGCKNAYNPSSNVRLATKYTEGSVCKYWNMCLLCDNSIITQSSLPKLINYKDKMSQALSEELPSTQSRKKLFEETIALISGILEPGNIFPKEVINHAYNIAATRDDLLIDQLVYQGA